MMGRHRAHTRRQDMVRSEPPGLHPGRWRWPAGSTVAAILLVLLEKPWPAADVTAVLVYLEPVLLALIVSSLVIALAETLAPGSLAEERGLR